ncbi:MAG: hypothetical protein V3V01_20610 [Acidimicrobiales bacterium]
MPMELEESGGQVAVAEPVVPEEESVVPELRGAVEVLRLRPEAAAVGLPHQEFLSHRVEEAAACRPLVVLVD